MAIFNRDVLQVSSTVTMAVAKGRILQQVLPYLCQAGFHFPDLSERSRRLVFMSNCQRIRLIIVRSWDVITYVDHGAAGLGIVGKDCLLEHDSNNLYEVFDLGIARCRLVLAESKQGSRPPRHRNHPNSRRLIATKYVNITRQYFIAKGEQVEVVKLYGSMEIAPKLGLADAVVDLVDSGRTLAENDLQETEELAVISARLVANKVLMKAQHQAMQSILALLNSAQRDGL